MLGAGGADYRQSLNIQVFLTATIFFYNMVCAAGEPTKRGTEQSGRQQSSGSDSSIAAANSDRRGRKPAKKRGRQQNLSRNKVIEWLANRGLKYEN